MLSRISPFCRILIVYFFDISFIWKITKLTNLWDRILSINFSIISLRKIWLATKARRHKVKKSIALFICVLVAKFNFCKKMFYSLLINMSLAAYWGRVILMYTSFHWFSLTILFIGHFLIYNWYYLHCYSACKYKK